MCDDRTANKASTTPGTGMSRRNFLQATASAAAAASLLNQFPRLHPRSTARPAAADGKSAYSMAMHVHSSFSEQSGSMDSQLFQAASNAVDVLWWTDHDARMDGIGYRKTVHFTSLTRERGAPGQGGAWAWTRVESGPLGNRSEGGIVQSPSSPNDPVSGGSMHLSAESRSPGTAKLGFYANSHPAGWNYRDNLTGQSLAIDVRLTRGWTDGYLELLIDSSYHEGAGGHPAGGYSLSYRFVPEGAAPSRVANGLQGIITIPVRAPDRWSTVTITPSEDIAALWPALDSRDFALWELTLSAASQGAQVGGYFDYLRFDRTLSGGAFLHQQMEMGAALAPKYSGVTQQQGLEVSRQLPHLNWFGGDVTMPDYGSTGPSGYRGFLRDTAVPQIHAAGGLVSYNHPFGYGGGPLLPASQQDALLTQVARDLLPTSSGPAVLGTDLLEVGYPVRAGVDLARHVALWDVMSRNAVFLTGNGTNDDHMGQNWHGIENNWFTSAWATSTAQHDLLSALSAGRSWCASLSEYRGSLDMMVDGTCPMGSVSVSGVTSRELVVAGTHIPRGGSIQVLQGAVDYAGGADPRASSKVIGTYAATDFSKGGGSVTQSLDSRHSSFVRTQVVNRYGGIVGVSNPVWLLRHAPPGGIPAPRAA
jgi:hypothetical protein